MIYTHIRPHSEPKRVHLEVLNEWMVLVACYHLICFSEFNLSSTSYFTMGYSYVGTIGLVVAINIGAMLYNSVV